MTNKTLLFSLVGLFVLALLPSQPTKALSLPYSCAPFEYNFGYGMRDGTGDNIVRLQNILISQGYLSYGSATGYFGPMTRSSVRRFQAVHGIPTTGYVASLTRAALYNVGCVGQPPIPPIYDTQAPTISSISPSSGPFGTVVTIYGYNFSRTGNNSINFANISNVKTGLVSNDGTSIQFVVPATPCSSGNYCAQVALATGQYPISVTTPNGTSNSVLFYATDSYQNGNGYRPVINGVDGPTSLATGQQGTWTIRASDPSNGYLSYSVLWGDEGSQYNSSAYPVSNSFTQTTSFGHTYYNPGTYTITFTVRNGAGYQTESRTTVYVSQNGGTSYGAPSISYLSPTNGYFGTVVTVTGANFTRYDNSVNFAGVSQAYTSIPSYDGRTLQFTPTATPCASGNYCSQIALNSGDYQVSVTNQYGTSNSTTYRVGGSGTSDQTQTLSLNQIGYFDTVRLTPTVIAEDSRCAADVTCIQAGKVVVLANVSTNSGSSRSISLSSNGEIYSLDDGYKIQITAVFPTRYSNQGINGDQYRITFRVWR